ncbi:MAG: hypothetical protein A2622_09980 [Bdellovibrionales bacterium RIFCSPHIGHO2_01_FULL_40_29]|nr:MAG: hypothetical protein A2622_09980 [Bdellovibrionales bacterium RIFCSPHIGHO2_01_FULL_40_29]OFZ32425.1 MAG: hypothetical protein A3D17_12680 [Bdellovibrionales bacterium RIFCSPHIGHO2_02_FULL_40_15]
MKRLITYTLYPVLLFSIFGLFYAAQTYGWDLKMTFAIMAGVRIVVLLATEFLFPAKKEWMISWGSFLRDLKYMMSGGAILGLLNLMGVWLAIDYSRFNTGIFQDVPVWLELVITILIYEFFQYWYHRYSHENLGPHGFWFWKVHAAHHLPDKVYLLMHPAGHPINFLITLFIVQAPLVLLESKPEVIFLFNALLGLQGLVSHFNVEIKVGFLNYILVGTELHRFHHSADPKEAKNYGVLTSFWDIAFGTFYYHPDLPARLGVFDEESYPRSNEFIKVMKMPFVK